MGGAGGASFACCVGDTESTEAGVAHDSSGDGVRTKLLHVEFVIERAASGEVTRAGTAQPLLPRETLTARRRRLAGHSSSESGRGDTFPDKKRGEAEDEGGETLRGTRAGDMSHGGGTRPGESLRREHEEEDPVTFDIFFGWNCGSVMAALGNLGVGARAELDPCSVSAYSVR